MREHIDNRKQRLMRAQRTRTLLAQESQKAVQAGWHEQQVYGIAKHAGVGVALHRGKIFSDYLLTIVDGENIQQISDELTIYRVDSPTPTVGDDTRHIIRHKNKPRILLTNDGFYYLLEGGDLDRIIQPMHSPDRHLTQIARAAFFDYRLKGNNAA